MCELSFPWDKAQGGRDVVKTLSPYMRNIYLRGSVPRDVGYILFRDVGFGVTIKNSNFGGGVSIP